MMLPQNERSSIDMQKVLVYKDVRDMNLKMICQHIQTNQDYILSSKQKFSWFSFTWKMSKIKSLEILFCYVDT